MMARNLETEAVWDVVVAGAGLAGLTASVLLAKAGKRVLLLEKSSHAGGRAMSTELVGARVNLGGHALYASALPILQEAGVSPAGAAPKAPGALVFRGEDGAPFSLPLSRLLLGSFLSWREKLQLLRFYSQLRRTAPPSTHPIALQSYLEAHLPSSRVRTIVLALVRLSTYCDAPHHLSAGAALEGLRQTQVLYVNGGWQSIVDQLWEQALQAGVVTRTLSPVLEVTGHAPHMTVKLRDGSVFAARTVVSTAGPKESLRMLNPPLSPAAASAYERLKPVYAACLDLVVSGMPQPKTTFVLGADDPWYYSNHSAAASFSADPGREVVHVMKYLPVEGSAPGTAGDEQELERFLDAIQPGWRQYVLRRRFLPRMLVTHAVAEAAAGGLPGRPGPSVSERPGFYVAGDWVGPGSGADDTGGMLAQAALTSARAAARRILEDWK